MCDRVSVSIYSVVLSVDLFNSTNVLLLESKFYRSSPFATWLCKVPVQVTLHVTFFTRQHIHLPFPMPIQARTMNADQPSALATYPL